MKRVYAFFLLIIFSASTAYAALGMNEQSKVDALLSALSSSNVTFIRNGEHHDGKWAAQHLREKLGQMSDQVNTAQDFITKVASASRESKKPYMIKTADGKTEPAGKWFEDKLKEIKAQQ